MITSTRLIRSLSSLLVVAVNCILCSTPPDNQKNYATFMPKSSNVSETPVQQYKMWKVWIASSISVFIISSVGLLGVAVVPMIQKIFYNKIIQYLVALAVGTLTGDAFLHLIPHAIIGGHKEGGESKENNEEFIAVMKGLVALGGILFFFLAEKSLSMISDYRAEIRAEEEERPRQIQDPRRSEMRRMSALCMSMGSDGNKRGSHMSIGHESAMYRRLSKIQCNGTSDDNIMTTGISSHAMKSIDTLLRFADPGIDSVHSGLRDVVTTYQPPAQTDKNENSDGDINILLPSLMVKRVKASEENHEDEPKYRKTSALVNNIETKQIKHGHSHGPVQMPGSIVAVAWMVIFGDGLHNFTDGLAIGAAFADSFAGGISTTVAVFCHELPHELGDFAVLLKTGMEVKRALFYNIVSSILCFFGMFIGIGLHNVENATNWIFAVTAGIFVYIALVDMLPELNLAEVREGESRITHVFIQILGLMTGIGIMLLIAMFEEDIKTMMQ